MRHGLARMPKAERRERLLRALLLADRAFVLADLETRHDATPAGSRASRGSRGGRPRVCRTVSAERSCESALIVARTTFTGLVLPSDFERMSLIPADSTTARTEPPAMTPVPFDAGRRSTEAAPNRPVTWCGMDRSASGTRTMCFFASSTPLRIASGTSSALPRPAPTWPRPSPTTTTAEKLNRRPPFTTLDTRLIWTTRSVSSSRFGSILAMSPPSTSLELQARLAGRVAERLDPAVIAVATAVEHDVADPGGLRALRDELADLLRALGLLLMSRRRSLFDVEVGRGGE